MRVTVTPSTKWDLERFIYSDPALNGVERFVALQILKTLDNKFRPVRAGLMSQALIGYRVHAWRETVNRAVRKLVILGYFRASWVSVPRATKQGIKGVTRVMCELGPVLRRLVDYGRTDDRVSPGQPRGVTGTHPSPTPPGRPGTVSGEVVAKSADRSGEPPENSARFKRETLSRWPRLAGSKPRDVTALRSHLPIGLARDHDAYRAHLAELDTELGLAGPELSADEDEARYLEARRRKAAAYRDELARLERHQPRRRPPRSHR